MFIVFLVRRAGIILQFLRSLVENVRFASVDSHFWRKSRGKRSFWKASFSDFGKVSWKTLVLEVRIPTFCESLVEDARFENGARANLRFLAVPLGGCANACAIFFWAGRARGGCEARANLCTFQLVVITSGKEKRTGKLEQKRKGEGKDTGKEREWEKQRVCVFFVVCCCRGVC